MANIQAIVQTKLGDLKGALGDFESKLKSGVIWNLGSLVVLAASGIVINTIIARYVGAEALGVFNQVFAIYIVASQLGVGGLQHSVLKHISHVSGDPLKSSPIVVSALFLVLMSSVFISGLLYCLIEPFASYFGSSEMSLGVSYILPGLIFFALNKMLLLTLSGMRFMRAFAIFQSLRFIFIMLGIGGLIYLESPAGILPLSLSLAEAGLFILLLLFTLKHLPLWRFLFSRGYYKKHISFGIRGSLSGILLELNTRVDIIMLGLFLSDKTVGIYSFAAILAEGFRQLPAVVRWNLDPIYGRSFAEQDIAAISELASKVKRFMGFGMAIIGIIAIACYPILLSVLVGNQSFDESWIVFSILMIGVILNAGFSPSIGLFLQGGCPGTYSLMIASIVLCNVLLNATLIPTLGMSGAALGTGIAFVFEAVVIVFLARRLFDVRF